MRTILATRCALALTTVLALAPFASAEALQVGQVVAAEWTDGRFYEGTVKAVDGGNVMVAWKDGSEPLPVAAERVIAVPKNEKRDATVGALGLCAWQSDTQWWDCRIDAVTAEGASVTYLYDGTNGSVGWNMFLIPTGKLADELKARAAAPPAASDESSSDSDSAPAAAAADPNAGFDPTLQNSDSDAYEYDLECGGSSTHSSVGGSTSQTLSKNCKLKIFGTEIELKGNMACEIRSGSISCR